MPVDANCDLIVQTVIPSPEVRHQLKDRGFNNCMPQTLSELVAAAALECFEKLPEKFKPRTHSNGRREWTPMSAIVMAKGDELTCVSLASVSL